MNELVLKHGKLVLVEGDITKQKVDAIVNAANGSLMGGGGVDGAIHRAGGPAILEECKRIVKKIGRLVPGKAVITIGGTLPARHVIHTVGPIWSGGGRQEAETLASCYRESLKLAKKHYLKTIAFPSISTGAYGYPIEEAAKVALKAIIGFLDNEEGLDEVAMVLWDKQALDEYSQALERMTTSP
jgi:O-acetyl-ADP-ribose deacetylase (regulator of RNase III)